MADNTLNADHSGLHVSQLSNASAWSLIASSILVYIVYSISTTLYDVYYGPLAKFPGPKLWAASRLPYIGMLWNGQDAVAKNALHKKYGPVVRMSPTELSYCDPQAWKDIYGHRTGNKKSFPKDSNFYALPINKTPSIIVADDATHTRHRRVLAHAFSDKALKEQEPMLKHWAEVLVTKLQERAASSARTPLDIVSWWNFTTFDIMGDLTFAEPLHMLEGSEYSPWVKTIFESIKIGSRLRAVKLLPGLKTIIRSIMPNSMIQKQIEHFNYSADRVDRRLAREDHDKPDLWDQVLKRAGKDGAMSVEEMHSNSSVFMVAGTETTATWLSGLTYYLLRNPTIMTKLIDEVRTTFSTEADITIETLAKMTYLNACLEEGLRMYPPVPTGMPRRTPDGGAMICGQYVPEDITVSVSHWSSYRSEDNWHLPDQFIPERWTGDERFKNDNHTSFQPFSFGPRNCIGRNLAYHEARLLLAEVLWHFDLSLDKKSENWADQIVYTLWEKNPLWVSLKPVVR